ncbi:MAG: PLP-dependent cysteine synthase family protein [Anaerolineales bacterium]
MNKVEVRQIEKSVSFGLLEAVGSTPLAEILNLNLYRKQGVRIFAKAEWLNPTGSVKDRPAANIIRIALEAGALKTGVCLLDSTSGNMGISYAAFAGSLGIPVTLVIPASASQERFVILELLGADLVLSDALEGSDGAIQLAKKMADENPGWFYADQYNNEANWQAHYRTTGPEIWEQTRGEVTHFVAGLGTTGTLMGAGRFLREQNPDIKIIGFQPDSPFHGLEGLKHMPSAIKPGFYDPDFADEVIEVSTEESYDLTRKLASKEGMFLGVSSGAALVASLSIASQLTQATIVTLFPDAGFKYLSESFWGFEK